MVLCCKNRRSTESERVPEFYVRHKEPDDKWWFMTNIPIEWDKELITNNRIQEATKVSRSDEKLLLLIIDQIKNEKSRKPKTWQEIHKILIDKQKIGEIRWHVDITEMKANSIQKLYTRIQKKQKPNEESTT